MTEAAPIDAFLETTYEEAVSLLVDLRDFVSSHMVDGEQELAPDVRMLMVQEVTRATRRMTNVMAWLMLQKAVVAGEMNAEDAAGHEAARLEDASDDSDETRPSPEALVALPMPLRGLIDRTRRVQDKAVRLKVRREA